MGRFDEIWAKAFKYHYQTFYDEILLLKEVEYTYYKAKLLAGRSDGFVTYIDYQYSGTFQTYQYTQKNPQFLTQRKEYQDVQTNCH